MRSAKAGPKKRTSWSITWRGGLLGLSLVFIIGFGVVNRRDWLQYVESTHQVEHTYQVLALANGLRNTLTVSEAAQRAYLLTGEPRYLDRYRADLARIPALLAELRGKISDNPEQKSRLDLIDRTVAEKLDEMRETIQLRREHGLEAALAVVRTDRGLLAMEEVARFTGQLRQEEQRLQEERSKLAEDRVKRSRTVSGLAAWVLIVLLVVTTIAIERDIGKRRRAEEALRDSEEQFRQVFEESPSGILLIEEDLRIRRANPAFCRMLGYENDELRNMTLLEISPPGSAFDRQYRTKSGAAVWVNVNETVVRNSHGGVLYQLALVEDVTVRRNADQEIRALKDSLEQTVAQRTAELAQTNKELESFAYSVSHDLRAPLRSVASFSQIVLEEYADKLDTEGANFLERIRCGAKTMSQLIDDLLDLSRLSRAQLRRQSVDLSAIASRVVGEWRGREPWRVVEVEIAPEVQAACDSRLLSVVLENLLGNAWKFTSKIEKARLEFGSFTQQGGTVYFVRDNGAGFDMAYASQLFGPFQRLHQATEFEGTGIGLATVQRVVHRHGGSIWAESAVGQGATFYFTLPGEADRHKENGSKA